MKNNYYSLWLTGICTLIFILQSIFPIITDLFKLTTSKVLTQPWTLITCIFLHGSITHLLYNMFALALFGLILEHNIGTKKFLTIFFTAGLFASLASIPFYNAVLGASGAIFGVLGALTILKPKMVIWLYGIPMPMVVAAIIWILIDLIGIFVPGNTANIAHLSGIFIGFVFSIFLIKTKQKEIVSKSDSISDAELNDWEERYLK